jgi:hypothetical protein
LYRAKHASRNCVRIAQPESAVKKKNDLSEKTEEQETPLFAF